MRRLDFPTVAVFVAFLFGLTLLDLSKRPGQISRSERRGLAQFPELTAATVLKGQFAEDYSLFMQDQVVFRDAFRSLKSFVERRVLLKAENDGVYVIGGHLYDQFYGINQGYMERAAELMNAIIDSIDSDRVFLAVIPSKAHLLAGSRYPLSDQNAIADFLRRSVQAQYIDLMHTFGAGDEDLYYVTDHHWTTAGAMRAYAVLIQALGYTPAEGYELEEVTDTFAGSLYGRAADSSIPRDRIYVAHNAVLDSLTTCRYESMDDIDCRDSVYFHDKLGAVDQYEVFLGGPAPIIVIDNELAPTNDELVLFKDSYAHALAPFLAQHFRRVTLFDLRYIRKELIFEHFDLAGKDVLFLYGTVILNVEPRILN